MHNAVTGSGGSTIKKSAFPDSDRGIKAPTLVVSIRKLPDNVLVEAFEMCIFSTDSIDGHSFAGYSLRVPVHHGGANAYTNRWEACPTLILSHICRHWRNIVFAQSKLWSSIIFAEFGNFTNPLSTMAIILHYTEQSNTSLKLLLKIEAQNVYAREMFNVLLKVYTKWHHITLWSDGTGTVLETEIEQRLRDRRMSFFPTLERLRTVESTAFPVQLFSYSPQLQVFHGDSTQLRWSDLQHCDFRHLQELRVECFVGPTGHSVKQFLQCMPALKKCSFKFFHTTLPGGSKDNASMTGNNSVSASESDQFVANETPDVQALGISVQTLDIYGAWDKVRLSALNTLHLHGRGSAIDKDEKYRSLRQFYSSLVGQCTLRTLKISNLPWKHTIEFIRFFPSITDLTLHYSQFCTVGTESPPLKLLLALTLAAHSTPLAPSLRRLAVEVSVYPHGIPGVNAKLITRMVDSRTSSIPVENVCKLEKFSLRMDTAYWDRDGLKEALKRFDSSGLHSEIHVDLPAFPVPDDVDWDFPMQVVRL